jgi:hypothetical protein
MIKIKVNGPVPLHGGGGCMGNKGKPTDILKFRSVNGFSEIGKLSCSGLCKRSVSAITETH